MKTTRTSLRARIEKLEEVNNAHKAKTILVSLATKSDNDIKAYIGKDKGYYKRENESYSKFIERIENDVSGIVILRASYE